jgi:hypothetical protein
MQFKNAIEDVDFLVRGTTNRELGTPRLLIRFGSAGWSELRTTRKPVFIIGHKMHNLTINSFLTKREVCIQILEHPITLGQGMMFRPSD